MKNEVLTGFSESEIKYSVNCDLILNLLRIMVSLRIPGKIIQMESKLEWSSIVENWIL